MDNTKDMEKSDTVSRFVDSVALHTNPFGGNRAAFRLYGRCERVVAAVYLLTRHVDPSEPVRSRIRTAAMDLLDSALELRDEMRADGSASTDAINQSARKLISFTRMLSAGSFISFANAEVLIGALDELSTFISASQRTSFSENITLTKDDLIGHELLIAPTGPNTVRKNIKDTNRVKDTSMSNTVSMSNKMSDTNRTSDSLSDRAENAKTDFRSQAILQLLSGTVDLGIKDIRESLPEFSEKTVQRALADLVREGRIKKSGEKRWSRYSLLREESRMQTPAAGL